MTYDKVDLIINFSETLRNIKTVPTYICKAITKFNSDVPQIELRFGN